MGKTRMHLLVGLIFILLAPTRAVANLHQFGSQEQLTKAAVRLGVGTTGSRTNAKEQSQGFGGTSGGSGSGG